MGVFGRIIRRFRSAITGRWVPAAFAKLNPHTTVSETRSSQPHGTDKEA